jgi:glycerol-3-phosphate dehydrogenase
MAISSSRSSLVGGKWTSFRAFSEQVTNLVLERLDKPRKLSTKDLPIGGGKGYPEDEETQTEWLCAASEGSGLPKEWLEILFNRYGTRAKEVAEFIATEEDHPLQYKPSFSQREILYLVNHEMVLHLEDLVRRRTNLMKLGELTLELVEELAWTLQKELGWSEKKLEDEISHVLDSARLR